MAWEQKAPFHISSLAMIVFSLSAMLDTGEYRDITIDDVKRHAAAGDLLMFLRERNGGEFAMGIGDDNDFGRWWVKEIADNCRSMDGRERRKYGIKNNGLCLLISYTAEIIQQGKNIRLT